MTKTQLLSKQNRSRDFQPALLRAPRPSLNMLEPPAEIPWAAYEDAGFISEGSFGSAPFVIVDINIYRKVESDGVQ